MKAIAKCSLKYVFTNLVF